MESLGDDVSRPFLQGVVKFDSAGEDPPHHGRHKPLFVPQILVQAGPGPILDWFGHFANLGVYTLLSVATERGPIANAARLVAGAAPTREVLRGNTRRIARRGVAVEFRRAGCATKIHAPSKDGRVEVGERERLPLRDEMLAERETRRVQVRRVVSSQRLTGRRFEADAPRRARIRRSIIRTRSCPT